MLGVTLATQGPTVADRKGLRVIGFIFGTVTSAVVLIAGVFVHAHVNGGLGFDDANSSAVTLSSSQLAR
jgi:hypothetical protein